MDPVMKAMLAEYVKSITFESNLNDPVRIEKPFAEKPPGLSDKAMTAIKPKFVIELFDEKPIIIAPGGEPSRETRNGVKVAAGLAAGGLLLYALLKPRK